MKYISAALALFLSACTPQNIPDKIPVVDISKPKEKPPLVIIPKPDYEVSEKETRFKDLTERVLKIMYEEGMRTINFSDYGGEGYYLELNLQNESVEIDFALPDGSSIFETDKNPPGPVDTAMYCSHRCITIDVNGPLRYELLLLQEIALMSVIEFSDELVLMVDDRYYLNRKIDLPKLVDACTNISQYYSKKQ